MKNLFKAFIFTSVFSCIALLMGCQNTVQGVGKDMQHTGQKIEHSAEPTPN